VTTLAFKDAEILEDGRILRVRHVASPDLADGGGGVPDWLPGASAGLQVTLSTGGGAMECLGVHNQNWTLPPAGLRTWDDAGSTIPAGRYFFNYAFFDGSGNALEVGSIAGAWDSSTPYFSVAAGKRVDMYLPRPVPAGQTCRIYATAAGGAPWTTTLILRDVAAGSQVVPVLSVAPLSPAEPPPSFRSWCSYWNVPASKRVAWGDSLTFTMPAAALTDGTHTTVAVAAGAVTNYSIVDADGWCSRDFGVSGTGLRVYVSDSRGNDGNSGLTPTLPKKTISAAFALLPNNSHSNVRLLRGDTFPMTASPGFRAGVIGDRTKPFVIDDYWDASFGTDPGTRPHIDGSGLAGDTTWGFSVGGGFGSGKIGTIIIRRISMFRGGLTVLAQCDGMYMVDCKLQNGLFSPFGDQGYPIERAALIRTTTHDNNPDVAGARKSGIYGYHFHRLLMSEAIFDRNGWAPNDYRDVYSHNVYLQNGGVETVSRGCWFTRGCLVGIQARGGGLIAYGILSKNGAGGFVGGSGGWLKKLVCVQSDDTTTTKTGTGLDLNWSTGRDNQTMTGEFLIVANAVGGQPYGVGLRAGPYPGSEATVPPTRNLLLRHSLVRSSGHAVTMAGSRTARGAVIEKNALSGDPADTGERLTYNFVLSSAADSDISWLTTRNNVLAMPQESAIKPIYLQRGAAAGVRLTVAEAQALGLESGSVDRGATAPPVSAPDYVLANYAAASGLSNEAGYYAAIRSRLPGVWPSWLDVETSAWPEFSRAYTLTDAPAIDQTLYGFYGAADYRSGITPPTDPGPDPEPDPDPDPPPGQSRRRTAYVVMEVMA
jgi:hypothetical protein